MTIKRYYWTREGMTDNHPLFAGMSDAGYVRYDEAKRDIQRLSDELFAARAALHALEKQRAADIAVKDWLIDECNKRIAAAGVALGFDDPDERRS